MSLRRVLQQRRERNRENDMVRKAALREKALTVPEAIEQRMVRNPEAMSLERLEQQARDIAGVTNEITQENVRKACIAMSALIKRQGCGPSRAGVLVHMPKEIRGLLETRLPSEVFNFYWSLKEFQTVWAQLGFDKDRLVTFIGQAVKARGGIVVVEETMFEV